MKTIKNILYQELPFLFSSCTLAWQLVFAGLPLCMLGLYSFIDTDQPILELFYSVVDSTHMRIIGWSLWLAFAVSITCLVLAYPIAYWVARKLRRLKLFFLFLLIVPFWTNLLILAYAWILILQRTGMLNTAIKLSGFPVVLPSLFNNFWAIYIVCVYCYLPFMILPLYVAIEKIDHRILEASADLGASMRQTFSKIIVPLSWSGIRTGFLLVFVPMFGEFAIPSLVGGDKYLLVGSTIAHYVFTAFDIPKAALFAIVCATIMVCILVCINKIAHMIFYKMEI